MTGYILRPYDPAFLSPTIQRLYEQDILTQLQAYEGQWSAGEYALHMATYFAKRVEAYDDTLKKVTCDQFFALVNRLGDIIDEVLFESEEEVLDGDPTFFTDLPKEEQDGLCALLLNIMLQTLWPSAFLPSPPDGAEEEVVKEEKEEQAILWALQQTIAGLDQALSFDPIADWTGYEYAELYERRLKLTVGRLETIARTLSAVESLNKEDNLWCNTDLSDYQEEKEEKGQDCCVCGLPAEGSEQICTCVCPDCGQHLFDDLILSNRGRCWDCWKQWQLRPEQIAQEAQTWTTHRHEGEEER